MPDELDAQLRRRFANAAEPLANDAFSAHLAARIGRERRPGLSRHALYSILGTMASGLGTGLLLPWRLRHARLMVVGAAAATVWTAFL